MLFTKNFYILKTESDSRADLKFTFYIKTKLE